MEPTTHAFPNTDDLVLRNKTYAESRGDAQFDVRPDRSLAVIACMDSRLDVFALLGLNNGEAHVIRNAGGVITDDAIRSLCLSQRYMGTREVILIHHTDCGLHNLDVQKFNDEFEADVGVRPPWKLEAFADPFADVRQSIRRLEISPFIPNTDMISGFVYNVETGLLEPVE